MRPFPEIEDHMLAFVGQFFSNFKTTGALLPSGGMLAKAMTRSVRHARGARRILEVGPGTGAFTKHLLDALRDGDEFHIIEINETFAQHLEKNFLAEFRQDNPNIEVILHCSSIEDAGLEGVFDFIICGLPFNNFPAMLVRQIFRKMLSILAEGGKLTYFEYAGIRVLKSPIVGASGRKKLRRHRAIVKALHRRHHGQRDFVLANMPPAYALQLTRKAS